VGRLSGFCFSLGAGEASGDFFFTILRGRRIGDHPQEDVAKFGMRSERKAEFFLQTSAYTGDIQEQMV
jgi:hypothetical protein